MSPNRFINLILGLALTVVMADRFYFRVENVSAGRSDPPQFLTGCAGEPITKLLYHRSAKSMVVDPGNISSKHFLYHRSVKSCYPAAK